MNNLIYLIFALDNGRTSKKYNCHPDIWTGMANALFAFLISRSKLDKMHFGKQKHEGSGVLRGKGVR